MFATDRITNRRVMILGDAPNTNGRCVIVRYSTGERVIQFRSLLVL